MCLTTSGEFKSSMDDRPNQVLCLLKWFKPERTDGSVESSPNECFSKPMQWNRNRGEEWLI